MVHVCSCLRIGDDITRILMITPGVFSAHYSIEYRTHFTKMHQTVIGVIGATEQLCIIMGVIFWVSFQPESNASLKNTEFTIPVIDYQTNFGDVVIFFACVSGVHYNLENILVSIFST